MIELSAENPSVKAYLKMKKPKLLRIAKSHNFTLKHSMTKFEIAQLIIIDANRRILQNRDDLYDI